MELKQYCHVPSSFFSSLLIEPLWNWNTERNCHATITPTTFNRTTMELKHDHYRELLLSGLTFNRTTMELKRGQAIDFSQPECPFNRTTMELKRASNRTTARRSATLLIEPLWNWNKSAFITHKKARFPFNRTTMELKPVSVTGWYAPSGSF